MHSTIDWKKYVEYSVQSSEDRMSDKAEEKARSAVVSFIVDANGYTNTIVVFFVCVSCCKTTDE